MSLSIYIAIGIAAFVTICLLAVCARHLILRVLARSLRNPLSLLPKEALGRDDAPAERVALPSDAAPPDEDARYDSLVRLGERLMPKLETVCLVEARRDATGSSITHEYSHPSGFRMLKRVVVGDWSVVRTVEVRENAAAETETAESRRKADELAIRAHQDEVARLVPLRGSYGISIDGRWFWLPMPSRNRRLCA